MELMGKSSKVQLFARFLSVTKPMYTNDDLSFFYHLVKKTETFGDTEGHKREYNFEGTSLRAEDCLETMKIFFADKAGHQGVYTFNKSFFELLSSTYGMDEKKCMKLNLR